MRKIPYQLDIISKTWKLIKRNIISIFIYELTYRVATFIIAMSLFRVGVSLSLNHNNFSYLTEENFISFLMNPITILFLLIVGLLILFFLLVEISSIFVCFQYSYNHKKITVTDMFLMGVGRAVNFIKKRRVSSIICTVCSIPFLCGYFIFLEVYYIKILNYAARIFYNGISSKWIIYVIAALLILISLLFMFMLPYCLLKEDKGIAGAIMSVKLIWKKKFLRTLLGLVSINLIVFASTILFYMLGILLIGVFVYVTKDPAISIGAMLFMEEWVEMAVGMVGGALSFLANLAYIYWLYMDNIDSEKFPPLQKPEREKQHILIQEKRRKTVRIIIAVLLIAEAVYISNVLINSGEYSSNIFGSTAVTAHRGGTQLAPENTLLALETCIEGMVDAAEIDIQETKDGELVLLHDNNLKRTTGFNANIWEVTYDEIKELAITETLQDGYVEVQYVPTLRQALELCSGRLNLNIEIKYNGRNDEIVNKVISLIEEFGVEDQCVISSMNYDFLKQVKELKPEITTGYIMTMTYGSVANITEADFFSVRWTFISEEFVKEAHLYGKQVHAWTVNYRGAAERLKALSVDNIITDNPVLVKEVLFSEQKVINYLELLKYVFD